MTDEIGSEGAAKSVVVGMLTTLKCSYEESGGEQERPIVDEGWEMSIDGWGGGCDGGKKYLNAVCSQKAEGRRR